jgi:BirA family biotin operon repressor/biotin-[acetyl-CoA-carboxylase] ligase
VDLKDAKSGRQKLDSALISGTLASLSGKWQNVEVLETVLSTNDLAIEKLASNAGEVAIVTADEQTKGRGRLQRDWSSPPGAGIAVSIGCELSEFSFEPSTIPLAVGVTVVRALSTLGVKVNLKWPNDICFVADDRTLRKVGGILVQRTGDNIVIGIGLNVSLTQPELPTAIATSFLLEGFVVQRETLIAQIIFEIEQLANGTRSSWLTEYLNSCSTINSSVRVSAADGTSFEGLAKSISRAGGLEIEVAGDLVEVTVGDIEHLRHI